MRASLGLLMPLLLLQGCAGSPVARQLEGSFNAPPADQQPDQQAEQPPASAVQASDATQAEAVEVAREPELEPSVTAAGTDNTTLQESEPEISPAQPSRPYRITIRLAAADPAAPAEVVTRALRKAQVSFSVERIERIEGESPAAAPAAGTAASP